MTALLITVLYSMGDISQPWHWIRAAGESATPTKPVCARALQQKVMFCCSDALYSRYLGSCINVVKAQPWHGAALQQQPMAELLLRQLLWQAQHSDICSSCRQHSRRGPALLSMPFLFSQQQMAQFSQLEVIARQHRMAPSRKFVLTVRSARWHKQCISLTPKHDVAARVELLGTMHDTISPAGDDVLVFTCTLNSTETLEFSFLQTFRAFWLAELSFSRRRPPELHLPSTEGRSDDVTL